jgi:integrase/recombinase XerD
MVKRRARRAGLPHTTCCHTFLATGITAYLQNGGTIEHAQQIANHPLKRTFGESPRTTKLYDRTNDAISPDERACPVVPGIERILI